MPDFTDLQLKEMEKELNKIYTTAQKEIKDKWDKYMMKAQAKVDAAQTAYQQSLSAPAFDPLAAADLKAKYEKAALNMTLQNAHYQEMINQVTDKLSNTNQIALDYLNDKMPGVYCHSYNELGSENIAGYSFDLVSEDAVKNIIKSGNTSLLPQKQLNIPKDKQWNTKNINSQVLQGILQGESIPQISKRLQHVTDMNHASAVRNARTMTTGAENKGRQDSFTKAKNDGIIMKRKWVAAHDERLRDWHAALDGVEVDVDEPFVNDYGEIMYPGDPAAHPANVYNCRCAVRARIIGFKPMAKTDYASQYQGASVTSQYYSMLDEDKTLGNAFWKALNAEGKPSQVWKDYLSGNASAEVTNKLNSILAKYKGTGLPIKPGSAKKAVAAAVQQPKPDLGMYQDKSMTATFYSVKAEDAALGKEFWSILQAEANPSAAWNQYLLGLAPADVTAKLDKILLQHKGTGAWTKPVSAKVLKSSSTAAKKAPVDSDGLDDLAKAKADLAVVQGNLNSLGNKTYSGIWKEDVTLADYEAKKAGIAAKKAWYQDQIDHLDAHLDDLESWEKPKLAKYKQYLDDLNEFETQGKIYAQYAAEYKAAAKKVKDLTPVGDTFGPDAYIQARKDSAVWAKSGKEADSVLRGTTEDVWKNATRAEKDAAYDYTRSYHKYNEPLRGIEYGNNTYKGVGNTDLNAGYQNNGKNLNALTDIIEKSALPQDQWFQRGCQYSGMDKFFACDENLLRYGTQNELEQALLGKTVTEYGFMSMGSAKGQGFSGSILMNIYAPSGTKALYVEPFSAFGHGAGHGWDGISKQSSFGGELETLLQQNTDFRITKVERKSGTLYFDLEIIAQNEPQRWIK